MGWDWTHKKVVIYQTDDFNEIKNLERGKYRVPTGDKPLIGFFPAFASMGEAIPLVKIAQSYMDVGGKAIFFSHNRKFEYLAEDIGCKVVRLDHLLGKNPEKIIKLYKKGIPFEKILIRRFTRETIEKAVEEEIKAFKENRVELIVSAFTLTCSISARALKIPLVVVTSGVGTSPYYESGHLTFPEDYENLLTKMIPESLKKQIAKWYLLHNKKLTREFNKVASTYHVSPFKYMKDINLGDHTLICDDINFLGVQPSEDFPSENYIGPIISGTSDEKQNTEMDTEIESHLKRSGKSIVLVMGSSFNYRNLFPEIVGTLNKTDYTVIAVYKDINDSDLIFKTNENILFKEFIPLDRVLKKVDLAIIHGGRGTVYTVAYSGKPAIGIPITFEHQCNIDNLVRAGAGIRLSKRNLDSKRIFKAINTIFDNYSVFLQNSQNLSKTLTGESGEKKAVQRLIEIHQSYQKK